MPIRSRLPPPADDRRILLDLIERNVATLSDRPIATDADGERLSIHS